LILADTSVWIEHLRNGQPALVKLLELRQIFVHPSVIGELACGNLKNRRLLLEELANMPQAVLASDLEVMELLERRKLWGRGIGWTDLHLLASAFLTGCKLWTLDRRLAEIASELDIGHFPAALHVH
jgi:predicted nucleic acid-binding protein